VPWVSAFRPALSAFRLHPCVCTPVRSSVLPGLSHCCQLSPVELGPLLYSTSPYHVPPTYWVVAIQECTCTPICPPLPTVPIMTTIPCSSTSVLPMCTYQTNLHSPTVTTKPNLSNSSCAQSFRDPDLITPRRLSLYLNIKLLCPPHPALLPFPSLIRFTTYAYIPFIHPFIHSSVFSLSLLPRAACSVFQILHVLTRSRLYHTSYRHTPRPAAPARFYSMHCFPIPVFERHIRGLPSWFIVSLSPV
jgi:hypothetical protein